MAIRMIFVETKDADSHAAARLGMTEKEHFMFLHLGRDVAVAEDSIIVVFDMDTATWSRHTRNYLTAAEKAGKVYVITDELPKSAVVCRENGDFVVYISQISSKTLLKRLEEGVDALSGVELSE